MKRLSLPFFFCLIPFFTSCDNSVDPNESAELSMAFEEFDTDNVTIYLDGDEVVIETNGHPNHVSPYWSPGHELYVAPTVTTTQQMAPGFIDDFNGSFTLRVPVNPEVASSSATTGLGPIGISVTGAVIYNDQEGPMSHSIMLPHRSILPELIPAHKAIIITWSQRHGLRMTAN